MQCSVSSFAFSNLNYKMINFFAACSTVWVHIDPFMSTSSDVQDEAFKALACTLFSYSKCCIMQPFCYIPLNSLCPFLTK